MNDCSSFMTDEQRRSNVKTTARIETFCKKPNINIGCYDGFGLCLRSNTEKIKALYKYMNHFCLIWDSNANSSNKTDRRVKKNFKVVYKIISDYHVKYFIKSN